MLTKLEPGTDIWVETFCEDDNKGQAARKFYRSLGFVPDKLTVYENYPAQLFVWKRAI